MTPAPEFLKQYCAGCHNDRARAGNLSVEAFDPAHVDGRIDIGEKIVRKLRTGMMPPENAPKPSAAAREAFASALEGQLDGVAALHPDPGAPALHRLNRAEYGNAIRDLLALDVDVTSMLPPDDSAAGFDNNADVLGVSPALIDGYASAAAKVSRLAVGDPSIGLDRATYRVPGDLAQDAHLDGLPLGTRGGIVIHHTFPLDAEYDIEVGSGGGGRLGGGPPTPADDPYVTLDGQRITVQRRGATRMKVTAGPHTIAAAMIPRTRVTGADSVYSAPTRSPGISQVVISGPFNASGPGDTPSRRRLFVCTQATDACAKQILETLASRAYRQPVPPAGPDMERLLLFYREGRRAGLVRQGNPAGGCAGARRPAVPLPFRTPAGGRRAGRGIPPR